jgi:diguanylate cyclase (GGDEF)-like protein/PAS domain S-box-containing protein
MHGAIDRRFVSVTGICVVIVLVTLAISLTTRHYTDAASHQVDRVLLYQFLVQQEERLQRAESRLALSGTPPLTPFETIVDGMTTAIEADTSILTAAERASLTQRLHRYEEALLIEQEMALYGDMAIVNSYRSTVTIPVGTMLHSDLARGYAASTEALHAARSRASTVTILGAIGGAAYAIVLVVGWDYSHRRSRTRLATHEKRFRALIQQSSDLIVVTDLSGTVSYASPAAELAFGTGEGSIIGANLLDFVHAAHRDGFTSLTLRALGTAGQPVRGEMVIHTADGATRTVDMSVVDLIENDALEGMVYTAHDITDRTVLLESLRHQAHHDELTGLPNRTLMIDHLHALMATARAGESTCAVLFVDLDDFKQVNDLEGHDVGDQLLIATALGLRTAVRQDDVVARMGGDEFVVLLADSDEAGAIAAAERIQDRLASVRVYGRSHPARASIGIGVWTEDCQDIDALLKRADTAMYMVKQSGKSGYAVFRPGSISFEVAA